MPSESSISNPSLSNGLAFGVSIALFLYILSKYWFSSHRLPYPPGPRPLPIVGNLFDMPRTKYTLAWTKLGEEYGPLTWLTVPGQNFLIVNSMEAAKELLEKRGSVYVDRPKFVFLGEMIGADYFTSLTRYGPLWRKHRSLLKHALSPEVIKRDYSALLTENAEQYVDCLVERPGAFEEDLKRVMAESTVMLTYGRLRDEQDRDYVQLNSYVLETTLKASQGYIVDLIPALRYIPSWAPGMKFKRDAARWRDEFHEITRTMFERAKKSVISGEANEMSSFMTNNLRDLYRKQEQMLNSSELEADEAAISHSGFTFFLAAVETTQYSVHSFLLAMVLFPSVQEKARLEIDRVVGDGRLPTFDDQQDMPYLHAILLETLRWNTVVTTGLPHASLRDDIYDGYFIPKGTTVIPNAWGISRNTKYYSNPSVFDPERYLGPVPELDPRQFAFGFGRRICPGNELAFQAIWIMAAYILWSFRLGRAENDTSLPGDDLERFSLGFFSDPVSFKCEFLPRRENLPDKLKGSAT